MDGHIGNDDNYKTKLHTYEAINRQETCKMSLYTGDGKLLIVL